MSLMKEIKTPDDLDEFAGSWVRYETTFVYFWPNKEFAFVSHEKQRYETDGYELCHILHESDVSSTTAAVEKTLGYLSVPSWYLRVRFATQRERDDIKTALTAGAKLNYAGSNCAKLARLALE